MSAVSASTITPSSTFTDFTGRQLHVAQLRAAIIANEITAMGAALKAGLVDPENALAHLVEIGADRLLVWESSNV